MPSVLIGSSSFSEIDKTPLEKLIRAGFKVIDNPYKRKLTRSELRELLSDNVCGIIAGLEPLGEIVPLDQASHRVLGGQLHPFGEIEQLQPLGAVLRAAP